MSTESVIVFRAAPKLKRLYAHMLDNFVIFVGGAVVGALVGAVVGKPAADAPGPSAGETAATMSFAGGMICMVALGWLKDAIGGGRSFGKRMMKLCVVDVVTGEPAGLVRVAVRSLLSPAHLPMCNVYGGMFIDGCMVIARGDGRKLGDLLVGTVVVEAEGAPGP